MDKEIATNLIDIYWKDIHHSRNQDWKFLLAVLASILGLGQSESILAKLGFSLLGIGISVIGAIIAHEHRKLLVKKTCVIEHLECIISKGDPDASGVLPYYTEMCVGTDNHDKLSVSGLIFLFYFLFIGFFVAAATYFYPSIGKQCLNISVIIAVAVFIIGIVLMLYFGRSLKKFREKFQHKEESIATEKTNYMIVRKSKIKEYFKARTGKPLKIVASERWEGERCWNDGDWNFDPQNGKIIKDIHLNSDDLFQFSVADEHSPQEFHCHKMLYEIYISESKIKLFLEKDSKTPVEVDDGAVIIPPGIYHYVELSGITYILQAVASNDVKVSTDKETG
jgi:uncharacterized membrane protein (DUF485 family)